MLTYNERVVFNNGYFADVQLVFYDDGSGQGGNLHYFLPF